MSTPNHESRRDFFQRIFRTTLATSVAVPCLGFSNPRKLTLEFLTIPDPDGWHPSLRLKGDWLIFKISDGLLAGYGEASHSKQDGPCRLAAEKIFKRRIATFHLTLDRLNELEQEVLSTTPDFVTATAWSGINQALYDLLAKRERVENAFLYLSEKPGWGIEPETPTRK